YSTRVLERIHTARSAIFPGQLQHALDAPRPEFALASMDGVADSADVGSGLVRTSKELKQLWWRAARTILIANAMTAAFGAHMLAQQLARARIDQPYVHRVPLHMDLPPDPARR